MRHAWTALIAAALLGCGGGGATGQGGGGTTSSSTSTGAGGTGGAAPSCPADGCPAGQACVSGACVADCRLPGATACAAGTVCDASDASPGKCVDPGAACVTTSAPEKCGAKVCGPGSACDGAGKCYPRVPCASVVCDAAGCYGADCACTRATTCAPAPLGTPGAAGTLHDDAFRKGLVDLEFDPTCTAWGVTLVSGPDYLRSIAPDGTVASIAGVTNLNMGEVSVLQRLAIPTSGTLPKPLDVPGLDVSLTYICCAQCGCQLGSTPQGAARLDPMSKQIPMVIPSQKLTSGNGPFGAGVFDTGPAGLSYGTDRVLYLGNVNANGDYYRLDLETKTQALVTTFAARVHAAASFDAITMLIALEGGELRLLRVTDGVSTLFATSDSPVTALVRDFFDGAVYVARRDGAIWKYDAAGQGAAFQTAANPARIAIAPDGYLYALEIPPPFADVTPTIARWQLPSTR
jgi:hypothetical protein